MHKKISDRMAIAIAGKTFPGCVIGIVRKNGERIVLPFGNLKYDTAEKVTEKTVFDLASITKSIPTASLVLTFMAGGKLQLPDKVRKYLPELRNDYDATIEDLLRYRVKGVQMSKLKDFSADEIVRHIFLTGFDGPPAGSAYTNLPAFLLGIIIERIGGGLLAALSQEYLFGPLKMPNTTFFPNDGDPTSIIAPTEVDERGEVCGMPHDESAYVFAKAGRAVGHAGLFSTVPDLLDFLEALLQGKFPYIVAGAQEGLGWQVADRRFMGSFCRAKTFGKTGFTGTSVVCDMDRGIGLVILSNRTYPKRPTTDEAIFQFRSDISDIILASLS